MAANSNIKHMVHVTMFAPSSKVVKVVIDGLEGKNAREVLERAKNAIEEKIQSVGNAHQSVSEKTPGLRK